MPRPGRVRLFGLVLAGGLLVGALLPPGGAEYEPPVLRADWTGARLVPNAGFEDSVSDWVARVVVRVLRDPTARSQANTRAAARMSPSLCAKATGNSKIALLS
jgi:hypothetical protein